MHFSVLQRKVITNFDEDFNDDNDLVSHFIDFFFRINILTGFYHSTLTSCVSGTVEPAREGEGALGALSPSP